MDRISERRDPRATRYAKELQRIADRYDKLDNATIRRLTTLLQDLRKSLASELLDNPSDFQTHRLQQLIQSTNQLIDQFESQLAGDLRDAFGQIYRLGEDSVTEPLTAVGFSGVFNELNPAQLNVALDFSAVLVQNIASEMRTKIDTQLRLAVLGERSPFETMKAITDILGVKARGVVKGVAARAEAIVRTESTRIFNLAHHSQQQQAAKIVPGLLKRWVATGDTRTRPSHLTAHRRYQREPIPVGQPFVVGTSELMYPGDPNGPPGETINCRCRELLVVPEIGVVHTPLDARIAKELERRK